MIFLVLFELTFLYHKICVIYPSYFVSLQRNQSYLVPQLMVIKSMVWEDHFGTRLAYFDATGVWHVNLNFPHIMSECYRSQTPISIISISCFIIYIYPCYVSSALSVAAPAGHSNTPTNHTLSNSTTLTTLPSYSTLIKSWPALNR